MLVEELGKMQRWLIDFFGFVFFVYGELVTNLRIPDACDVRFSVIRQKVGSEVCSVWRHTHQSKYCQNNRHCTSAQTPWSRVHELVIETNSPTIPHTLTQIKTIMIFGADRFIMTIRTQSVRVPQNSQVKVHYSDHTHPEIGSKRMKEREVQPLNFLFSHKHKQSKTSVRPAQREINHFRTCFICH